MLLKTNKIDFWRGVTLLIPIAIFIYGMYLRICYLAAHTLWHDEINQLKPMEGSFINLLKRLPSMELNTYLNWDHFLIYPFFKIFSFNKWGLAIPHIVSAILGFYLLYLVSKRYFKTMWGYLISFIVVCFNATLIEHATEIRGYAVLPTLALACLYLSEMLINEINLNPTKRFFIGTFFLLTACFHTYGLFILFFCLIYALLNKPSARTFSSIFKGISKILVIVFSVGIPFWLFCVFGPFHLYVDPTKFDTYQFMPNPHNNIMGFLKSIFGNLLGFKYFYFLLIALVFPFVFPYKERYKQISFLFIMVFFPVLLILVCDLIGHCYFVQRQFIWVMPYFAIFLGWSCDSFISYVSEKLSFSKPKYKE